MADASPTLSPTVSWRHRPISISSNGLQVSLPVLRRLLSLDSGDDPLPSQQYSASQPLPSTVYMYLCMLYGSS